MKVSNLHPHSGGIINRGNSVITKDYPKHLPVQFRLVVNPSFRDHIFSSGKTGKFKDIEMPQSDNYHGGQHSWINMLPPFFYLPEFCDRPSGSIRAEA